MLMIYCHIREIERFIFCMYYYFFNRANNFHNLNSKSKIISLLNIQFLYFSDEIAAIIIMQVVYKNATPISINIQFFQRLPAIIVADVNIIMAPIIVFKKYESRERFLNMYLNYLDDSRENLVVNFSNITFPFFVVKTRNFQLHAGHFHLRIMYYLTQLQFQLNFSQKNPSLDFGSNRLLR